MRKKELITQLLEEKEKNKELNMKYLSLYFNYKELVNSCSKNEIITYDGKIYKITSLSYHKEPDNLDSIDITAVNVPEQKGLINNLAEPFKNVAKELNTMFFGDK